MGHLLTHPPTALLVHKPHLYKINDFKRIRLLNRIIMLKKKLEYIRNKNIANLQCMFPVLQKGIVKNLSYKKKDSIFDVSSIFLKSYEK